MLIVFHKDGQGLMRILDTAGSTDRIPGLWYKGQGLLDMQCYYHAYTELLRIDSTGPGVVSGFPS